MNTQIALTVELRLLAYAVFNLHRHVAALHPDRHQDLRPGQDGQLSGGPLRVPAAMVATALPGLILPH